MRSGLLRPVGALLVLFLLSLPAASAAADDKEWIVLTLKTGVDDLETVYHVFMIGAGLQKAGVKTTVVLYFEGARIADKRQPLDFKWAKQPETMQQMLETYIAAGGEVIACPLCAGNIGLTADDLRPGTTIGPKEAILKALIESDKIMDF